MFIKPKSTSTAESLLEYGEEHGETITTSSILGGQLRQLKTEDGRMLMGRGGGPNGAVGIRVSRAPEAAVAQIQVASEDDENFHPDEEIPPIVVCTPFPDQGSTEYGDGMYFMTLSGAYRLGQQLAWICELVDDCESYDEAERLLYDRYVEAVEESNRRYREENGQ